MKLNIDMAEATRLTREGRLAEAMAILQGGGPPEPEVRAPDNGPHIEMTQSSDGQWRTASETGASSTDEAPRSDTKPRIDLSALVGRFRGSMKTAHGHAVPDVPLGATFALHTVADAAGGGRYKLYVPSTYSADPAALMVMLHGCTQSPDDFAIGTRMNNLAEAHGFLVLYPEQSAKANMNRCWNWFNTADQGRDSGEPDLIVRMIRQVMSIHSIDPGKVFVAGLSAGGAMAAILGARYPDLIAGVAIHSGLAVGAAYDTPSAFGAMSHGAGKISSARLAVRTIVFHGDADGTVHIRNGQQVVDQAMSGRALTRAATDGQAGNGRYSRTVYTDGDGVAAIEYWILHGAAHAWSGGDAGGSYTDPKGPDASREMVRFFLGENKIG